MKQSKYTKPRGKDGKFASKETSCFRVFFAVTFVFTLFYMAGQVTQEPIVAPIASPEDARLSDLESLLKHKVDEIWDGEKFVPSGEFEIVKKAEAKGVEPTSAKTAQVESDVQQIIKDAADKYGVKYGLMKKIAECESGFNTKAVNKHSSARGLYQFTAGTWAGVPTKKAPGYRKLMGLSNDLDLRFDPVENANTAAYAIANGGLHNWEADPASYNCWKGAL